MVNKKEKTKLTKNFVKMISRNFPSNQFHQIFRENDFTKKEISDLLSLYYRFVTTKDSMCWL